MIVSDDMPQEVLDWVKAHAESVGDEVVAVNTIIIMYDAMDGDGDPYWNYRVMGETGSMRIAGMMELAKIRMLTAHIKQGLDQTQEDDDGEG